MKEKEMKRLMNNENATEGDTDVYTEVVRLKKRERNAEEDDVDRPGDMNTRLKRRERNAEEDDVDESEQTEKQPKTKVRNGPDEGKEDRNTNNEPEMVVVRGDNSSLSNSMEDIRAARAENEETKTVGDEMPPTYFKTNVFTRPFQDMNDVYGVPSYREINPAPFTMVSFPLLFGAMFGDVGHGLILVLLAFVFVKRPQIAKYHEMAELIVNARYMLLACGLASIYFGLLYSEFFGIVLPFFKFNGTTYFGVDPSWHRAENGINLMNGLKMKMSVLIGTFHMGIGLAIAAVNSFLNDNVLLFDCKVLPRILSFMCFAGYMSALIIYKWIRPFKPTIVNTIVLVFTDPQKVETFYPGQLYVQLFILALFVVCVPWMMMSYPLVVFLKKKQKNMSEIVIHIAIEAVFNIGLISNISSYLRVWAVSLAHSQLTSILHKYTMGATKIITRIVAFPMWIAATFIIMIALEGLGSSLHAMRLNWIEFNSKFYEGQGHPFKPLNFDEDSEV